MPSRQSSQQQDTDELTRLREESEQLRRERDEARALAAQIPSNSATQRAQERSIRPPRNLRSASITVIREHMGVAGAEHDAEWNRIRSESRACMDAAFFDYSLDLKSQDGRKLFECITAIEAQEPRFKRFMGNWGARYILQQSWTNRNAWRDAADRPDTYNGRRALKQRQTKGQRANRTTQRRSESPPDDEDNNPEVPNDDPAGTNADDDADDDAIDTELLVPPPTRPPPPHPQRESVAQKRRILSPPLSDPDDDEGPIAPAPKRRAVADKAGDGEDGHSHANGGGGSTRRSVEVPEPGSPQGSGQARTGGNAMESSSDSRKAASGSGGRRGGHNGGGRGKGGRKTDRQPTRRSGRTRK
ncbi:hypothetical protein CYLTODRAFT_426945 [Cylindrobasidium torrendii FP15055 ss-10]|uniref:Uncharacterized protein n=1 Tax=Cylindrobasidium torrendii FP15055 ss-10 TaxID=1314674 RepID=A0A0D7AW15_9AGAR|nr:hypothetical protein CYLTODRAFT_426945 [Cylindrobasidium torrendii FP15055 ss-10]